MTQRCGKTGGLSPKASPFFPLHATRGRSAAVGSGLWCLLGTDQTSSL